MATRGHLGASGQEGWQERSGRAKRSAHSEKLGASWCTGGDLVPTRGVCRTVRGDLPSQRCLQDTIVREDLLLPTARCLRDGVAPARSRLVLRLGDLKRHRKNSRTLVLFKQCQQSGQGAAAKTICSFIVCLTVEFWSFTVVFFKPGVFITFPQLATQFLSQEVLTVARRVQKSFNGKRKTDFMDKNNTFALLSEKK